MEMPAHTDPHAPEATHVDHTDSPAASAGNAAKNALAIVGFVALVFAGITLAVYSARFIPEAVSELSLAPSSLTSGTSTSSPTLAVVSTATTIPFSEVASTTTIGTVHTPPSTTQMAAGDSAPAASAPVHASAPATPRLYGLPDLSTHIISTGYLADGTDASFVPSQTVPADERAAVQFTVANDGTNATGPWSFIAELPTANGYVFTSPIEENLNPGDHILFTLSFTQANTQPGPQVVTVVADPNNQINETTKENNTESAAFTIAY